MAEELHPPEPSELLRLRSCPGCDYSLETLPAEGTCPECGRRYDQRFVVLAGRWPGAAARTWQGAVVGVVLLAALVWVEMDGPKLRHVLVGALTVLMLAAQGYAWVFSSGEPGMQLWLSPEGVGQVASTPEARRARSFIEGVSFLWWPLFYVGIFFDGRGPGLWFLLAVVGFVTAIAWAVRRSWREQGEAEGGADDVPKLWPWGQVKQIEVKALAGERARVRCMVVRRWLGDLERKKWVIDLEIACPAKAAEALGRQMVAWCPGADSTVA